MKAAVLFLLLALGSSYAAQGPAVVAPPRLASITALANYGPDGVMISFNVTAKFIVMEMQPSGQVTPQIRSVEFDLINHGDASVVVGSEIYDYREIAEIQIAVARKKYDEAFPGPLPTRRRALRTNNPP